MKTHKVIALCYSDIYNRISLSWILNKKCNNYNNHGYYDSI